MPVWALQLIGIGIQALFHEIAMAIQKKNKEEKATTRAGYAARKAVVKGKRMTFPPKK
jgi:hypothetical protein